MRIYLLAITLIISAVGCLTVQGQDSLAYKREISYNLLPFLRDPGSANFGFLFRLQQKSNQALRLGFDLRLNNFVTESNTQGTPSKSFSNYSGLAVGYEKQKSRNKFVFYYGPEAGVSLGNFKSEYIPNNLDTDMSKQVINSNHYTITGTGFFGARWFILSQLSLSVESGLQYAYTYSQNKSTRYFYSSNSVESQIKNNTHNINFVPIRAIYVGYHF